MLVRSPLLTSRRWRKLISSGRLICRCHHVFLWCYIYFALSRLTRDGTVEPVSRDQILRRERGQGNFHFLCSADHVQDWQPYPVDPYFCYMCDHTGRRPDSHTCFFLFSFSLFGDVTFSEYFFVPQLNCPSATTRPRVAVPGETNLSTQVTTDTAVDWDAACGLGYRRRWW